MSSADRDDARAGELIERLLVDPQFRGEFRRDPAAACLAAGLPDLAAELAGSGGSMDTLVVRESRSSLAGVVMAVAVEGMGVAEAKELMHHGLTGVPRGLKLPHGSALHNPLGHVGHGHESAALQRELRGLARAQAAGGSAAHGASPASEPSASPASSVSPSASAPPASSAASPPTPAPAAAPASSAVPAGSSAAAAPVAPEPSAAPPPPPDPGAQPARGGVVPVWPDQHGGASGSPAGGSAGGSAGEVAADPPGGAGAGASPGTVLDALNNPRLSAPPDARAFLSGGSADPKLVAVLNSALADHSIGLGPVTELSDPVHVQAVSIVSVDGQPVGPNNFAARDLVTEIAALDPSVRPTEIGTPWPIQSPGFYNDPTQQGQLHLAFVSSADYAPVSASPSASAAGPSWAAPAPGGAAPMPAEAAAPAPAASGAPAVESATPSAAPPAAAGHYVDPLPASARIGRTDMGVDANMNPGDAIVAPGTSRVLGITPNWYRGQPYIGLQLLDGPMKGHNYYLAEQITPSVSVGQIVQAGQPIAHYAASGTGIEIGWAGANWEQTLAQATTGYSEGEQTNAGASFRNFLDGLGHNRTEPVVGPDPDGDAGAAQTAAPPVDPDAVAPAPPTPVEAVTATPQTPPEQPGPKPFTVLDSRHHGAPRATVQFLPAVQPAPGSPLFEQAATPAAPAQAAAQAAAEPPMVAGATPTPEAAAPPTTPGGLLDQMPAAAPAGGSISVSSSLLTPGQAKFAGRLAELTGLDPHVVAAWELAEESGSAAQGREAASNFNWLNIGYFDSGAGKIAFDKTFGDPVSAAEQTAKFLKGEWGGASSSIRAILGTVGHSPDEQMAAIANSDWASSHYGGGANLHGTYNELGDIQIEKSGTT